MKIRPIVLAILLAGLSLGTIGFISGCASNDQQSAVNSLFKLQNTVDTAYASYLGLVASGAIPTNNVSQITQNYQTFQSLFAAASALNAIVNNTPPPNVELSNTVSQLLLSIEAEKAKKQ